MRFIISHDESNGWKEIHLTDTFSGSRAVIVPAAGAILNGFSAEHNGRTVQVIEGFADAASFRDEMEKTFLSAKLSPFVCRIRNAEYSWGGGSYHLQKFSLQGAALHGLLYDRPFEVIEEIVHVDHAELELKYSYTATDPGYPFPYDCFIRYRLEENNTLLVTTAIHNRWNGPIPVADGWHPYFTLGGKVDDLTLQLHASGMLEYDAALIPTGRTIPDSTWNEGKRIGDTRLDNGYVLDFSRPQPLCTLSDPSTGISVSFHPESSYPYLQLYIPDHRKSIAIENLSAAPDAFNNGIGLTVIEPDHTRTFSARYRINLP
jgi:aldose 1-epimerase